MAEIWFVDDFTFNPVGEDVAALAIALSRPVEYTDDDGFTIELQTGAIHPKKGWLAWVDYHAKEISSAYLDCNYYLRMQINGQLVFEWTIETYNPFFGCRVAYIAWHDDSLVMIYKEKHRCYGASLSLNTETIRQELGRNSINVCVREDEVFTYDTYSGNTLKRYKLPTWEDLGIMAIPKGIELGILEEI